MADTDGGDKRPFDIDEAMRAPRARRCGRSRRRRCSSWPTRGSTRPSSSSSPASSRSAPATRRRCRSPGASSPGPHAGRRWRRSPPDEIDALIGACTVPRGQGAPDPRHRPPRRRRARRRAALRRRRAAVVPGRRPEVRQPGAGHRLRPAGHRRRHPRPPRHQPLGLRARRRRRRRRWRRWRRCCRDGYWVEINRLLVPFGKHVCTGTRPRCSTCPVLDMCRQVGVTTHR